MNQRETPLIWAARRRDPRVGPVAPVADDRVVRVGVDVEDRGERHVDVARAQLAPERCVERLQ